MLIGSSDVTRCKFFPTETTGPPQVICGDFFGYGLSISHSEEASGFENADESDHPIYLPEMSWV